MFHNTIQLPDTAAAEAQCTRQERYVLQLFREYKEGLTSSEVTEMILLALRPEIEKMNFVDACFRAISVSISVKRSITNLTTADLLVKTDRKKMGKLGVENFVYQIK
ncbi:MAG TPA: hypothetical protein PKM97_13605 [Bacteroidia bacterium]|nr:hypothetical protein [Bacteroidia bacterium]